MIGGTVMKPASILVVIAVTAVIAAAGPASAAGGGDGAPPQPVALKTAITVEDEVVRLGDIFTGLSERADTAIAKAPAPGRQVRLTAPWLAKVATAYRVDWQPRSPAVEATVRRASRRLDGGRIRTAVARALRERGLDDELRVVLDNPQTSLVLPVTAPATLTVSNLSLDRSSGRFSANVLAPDARAPQASATVTGRAVRMVEVPVPAHRIERGEVIDGDDLKWIELPESELGRNDLTARDAIVGKSARRSARAGKPLRATDLETPVAVAKNSLVTIVVKTPRMQLTAQGRALEDASRGEAVRVVNTKSKATIRAVALGPHRVRVRP